MIRFLFFNLLIVFSLNLCTQSTKIKKITTPQDTSLSSGKTSLITKGAQIVFSQKKHNIGKVEQDSKAIYRFKFSNQGSEPLVIIKVRTNCHCTVASYPKTPVLPGESNFIVVEGDSKVVGDFNKTVAVYSNAINNYAEDVGMSRILLSVSWQVVKKPDSKK